MNEKNKLVGILVPIIAIIIIFESVLLVSRLNTNNAKPAVVEVVKTQEASQSSEVKPVESVLDLVFATDTKEMKVGKTYKMELNMVAKDDKTIDALETYIKYDPVVITVSGLSFNSKLPKPTLSKIDAVKGFVEGIILVEAKPGLVIKNGEVTQILSFNITPKKAGVSNLEISTGNDDKNFATMVVESVISKEIPLSVNKLEINVIK